MKIAELERGEDGNRDGSWDGDKNSDRYGDRKRSGQKMKKNWKGIDKDRKR